MPMTPREMIKLLEDNGFEYIRSNGSHRFFRNPITGKSTTVPFHNKALKPGTERNILKQAGLK
ncbi:type II toxin-antitoxin system HicA family toxin [Butyricicoccus faecihominis]|uniref:type II toxin-antitoxin system HicA family toxin n=1 Tax=Butyricicoccus faecihominis TaxID=1712515 RepID=UPI00247ACD3C|nr:type II toxin-antitoxin system HicA family toxin [Butyricicoccus faecihominis]MCQ5131429.1 type II toxin-antitoxin system HicA family toxin [Butyricicoccus faecihominis]